MVEEDFLRVRVDRIAVGLAERGDMLPALVVDEVELGIVGIDHTVGCPTPVLRAVEVPRDPVPQGVVPVLGDQILVAGLEHLPQPPEGVVDVLVVLAVVGQVPDLVIGQGVIVGRTRAGVRVPCQEFVRGAEVRGRLQ